MRIVNHGLCIDVYAVFNFGVEVDISVVTAEDFDDGEEGQGSVLIHSATGLGRVELTNGRSDHFGERSLDVYDVADDAALDQGDYVIECRAEGGLAGFEEDEVVALREVVELAGFGAREDERDLAENVLAGLEGTLGVCVVRQVRGGDVDRVDAFDEVVERGVRLKPEFSGEGVCFGRIGVQDRDNLGTADDLRLRDEPPRNAAGADNANAVCLLRLSPQLRA